MNEINRVPKNRVLAALGRRLRNLCGKRSDALYSRRTVLNYFHKRQHIMALLARAGRKPPTFINKARKCKCIALVLNVLWGIRAILRWHKIIWCMTTLLWL